MQECEGDFFRGGKMVSELGCQEVLNDVKIGLLRGQNAN